MADDAHTTAATMEATTIEVESMVASRSREPFVVLKWGAESGQLTPAQARDHARRILEAAEAADQDAFLVWWLTERVGATGEHAGGLLVEFRAWRAKRDPEIETGEVGRG